MQYRYSDQDQTAMDAKLLMSDRSGEKLSSDRDEEPMSVATAVAVLMATAGAACLALLCVCTLAWAIFVVSTSRPAEFSVTVNGFSGLEDRAPRAFNLTIGIDNLGGSFEVCVGGEAVVLYGGVPLAVGHVEYLCVPQKRASELAVVVAASGGVGVPKALAELMAAEKRADGVAHVEVRVISTKHSWFRSLSCMAELDDRAAPARPYPCN